MDQVLLDTDILNEVLKARNAVVVSHAAAYLREHSQFVLSAMTRYELLRGLKERGAVKQQAQFEGFCQRSLVVPIESSTLDRAADLWAMARRQGLPGRDADLIIAATALEQRRVLATANTGHVSWVPKLSLVNWREP